MNPQTQRNVLTMLIRNLVANAIEDANKGGGHPEDIPIIEDELRQSEMDLCQHINDLFPGTRKQEGQAY